ncbi:sodium:solute symporter family protein [Phragmitibacter flavus]|uniref:Sodium:solute symporter family protein n=1 Tax=Phragmitibacter flavus TaxID=2576071 RepID=A0A5R8KJ46_9BACT|nr:sodium:solute symporter family protein [Phragmitibacter flavus]TLD72346.1 sodium:solute symporter family protein [Phragmitibacter flavus]
MPITFWIILGYFGLLIALGLISRSFSKGTSADFFVVSRNVGPILLLLSIFGTTMTGFALVGSTGKAYSTGIGVYGMMASWSGLVHSAVFFLIGIRLWAVGKKYGYLTQCEYFRERFESPRLAYLLFPILVLLVIPYLLVGVISAGKFLQGATAGMFPEMFPIADLILPDGSSKPHPLNGSFPAEWGGLLICLVVLFYVFLGGLRGAVWANAFQTVVFMGSGIIAFYLISQRLGGLSAATQMVVDSDFASPRLAREGNMGHLQFFTYCMIPLSVGMFPHLFQHWLTARSAKSFRLTVVAHPIFIMIVWVPCILIGMWAAGFLGPLGPGQNPNMVLGRMVNELVHSPVLSGLVAAGVLAAIMSSLDSQFVCLGTMFTTDIVLRVSKRPYTDAQKIFIGRAFILLIVAVTYALAMWLKDSAHVFDLGVWCFTGFSALFPIVFGAVYWKRTTAAGAIAAVLVTAITWCILFYRDMIATKPPGADELLIFGMMPVAIITGLSALSLVIVSLLTRPPTKATVARFFPGK